jgi:hypothetical protein
MNEAINPVNYNDEQIIFDEMAEITKNRERLGRISMSESGYPRQEGYCRRKRVLSAYGFPGEISETTKRIFARGYMTERMIVEFILKRKYPRGHYNWSIKNAQFNQRGHPDYEWKNFIFEVKSISIDKKLDGPIPAHRAQLNHYLGTRMLEGKKDLVGRLYYYREGREFSLTQFTVPFSKALFDECQAEAEYIYEQYLVDVPFSNPEFFSLDTPTRHQMDFLATKAPAVPFHKLSYPCIWYTKHSSLRCQYFDWCWGKEERMSGPGRAHVSDGMEALAGEYYQADLERKAAVSKWTRLKGQVKTSGIMTGKVIGQYYIDKKLTIKIAREGSDEPKPIQ